MMKAHFITLCLIVATVTSWAQSPFQFNFQAVARNLAGNPLTNQSVDFRLSVLQGTVDGSAVYIEEQPSTTNNFGLANLLVGSGIAELGSLAAVDWANGPYFLQIELDIQDGEGYQLMGTSALASVPYALHAKTSEQAGPQGPQGEQGPAGEDGAAGPQGEPGASGLSAYEIWLGQGNVGTEEDFLASLSPDCSTVSAGGNGDLCRDCVQELSTVTTGLTLAGCADHCLNLNLNDATDWRMPTIDEVVYYRTALETGTTWHTDYIWTSTPVSSNGSYGTYMYIESTMYSTRGDDLFGQTRGCRCVR